jgi:hypothetical protein
MKIIVPFCVLIDTTDRRSHRAGASTVWVHFDTDLSNTDPVYMTERDPYNRPVWWTKDYPDWHEGGEEFLQVLSGHEWSRIVAAAEEDPETYDAGEYGPGGGS